MNNEINSVPVVPQKEGNRSLATVIVTLASINAGLGLPFVGFFAGIWLLFGAFSSGDTYSDVLVLCGSYIVASLVGLGTAIYNAVKHGTKLKVFLIATILSFVLSLAFGYITFHSHEIFNKNIPIERDAIIYDGEYGTIIQKSLIQDDTYLELKLDTTNSEAVFEREYVLINDIEVSCVYDQRDYYADTYIVRVSNSELSSKNIDKIKSFVLIIYEDYETKTKTYAPVKLK